MRCGDPTYLGAPALDVVLLLDLITTKSMEGAAKQVTTSLLIYTKK